VAAAFDLEGQPSAFNARTALVELAPGAAFPPHYHDSALFGLVLEGEVTRTIDGVTTTYQVGESWSGGPGEIHEYEGNRGPVPARFISSTLVAPGNVGLIPLP
jgi:quercetin dioxygenase-like cupin family protein